MCWSLAQLRVRPAPAWAAALLTDGLEAAGSGLCAQSSAQLMHALARWRLPELREGGKHRCACVSVCVYVYAYVHEGSLVLLVRLLQYMRLPSALILTLTISRMYLTAPIYSHCCCWRIAGSCCRATGLQRSSCCHAARCHSWHCCGRRACGSAAAPAASGRVSFGLPSQQGCGLC